MPRPIAQDHDHKRDAILRAAARLFADEGYGRASMAEVARACGISKANIYHYYSSKDALLFDILETYLLHLRDRIGNLVFPSDNPHERLRFLVTEILFAYQGADAEHEVLLNATRALPDAKQDILRAYQREFVSYGHNVIAKLASPDLVADRPKMRALTMSVFGMLNWHYKWCPHADDAMRRDHADVIAALVIGGIPNVGANE